jgi:mono/diheme cytochrome c family protein
MRGQRVRIADFGGSDTTGVPAELANASLVQRGQYLAHAADCEACHTAPGGANGRVLMPAFGAAYSDLEIAAVANYVTARFGARQSAIRPEDVAKLRGTS